MVNVETPKGRISIDASVISDIAGDAAAACFGVKGMAGRGKDGGVFALRRESMSRGVKVDFDESGEVSIVLHIVVEHGVNICALSRSIMGEVSYKVKTSTGLPVRKVDVFVDNIITE